MLRDPTEYPSPRRALLRIAPLVFVAAVGLIAFGLANLFGRNGQRPLPQVVAVSEESGPLGKIRESELTNSIGMRLIRMQPGRFQMGSPNELQAVPEDERPRREIMLTRQAALGACEVTRGQFRAFVDATGYRTEAERTKQGAFGHDPADGKNEQKKEYTWQRVAFAQTDDHPVICVSWHDAIAFCAWLSKKEGKTYELPTEAEWEYACRAGSVGRFHGGDMVHFVAEVGNVADLTARSIFPTWDFALRVEDGYAYTAPVGQYLPNMWGIHDLHGNVWEWCADWYARDTYRHGDGIDPTGAKTGAERVLRGGAWSSSPRVCRSSSRARQVPEYASDSVGFRVCLRGE